MAISLHIYILKGPLRELEFNEISLNLINIADKFISETENELGDKIECFLIRGSVARGEANENSDVDVMVYLKKGIKINDHILDSFDKLVKNFEVKISPHLIDFDYWNLTRDSPEYPYIALRKEHFEFARKNLNLF